jgi:hypothetical protein
MNSLLAKSIVFDSKGAFYMMGFSLASMAVWS